METLPNFTIIFSSEWITRMIIIPAKPKIQKHVAIPLTIRNKGFKKVNFVFVAVVRSKMIRAIMAYLKIIKG